jgi:hypothetical protein
VEMFSSYRTETCISITDIYWLMLFRGITSVYPENRKIEELLIIKVAGRSTGLHVFTTVLLNVSGALELYTLNYVCRQTLNILTNFV